MVVRIDDISAHAVSPAAVAERLGSDTERGLSARDAAGRLAEEGPKELDRGRG